MKSKTGCNSKNTKSQQNSVKSEQKSEHKMSLKCPQIKYTMSAKCTYFTSINMRRPW